MNSRIPTLLALFLVISGTFALLPGAHADDSKSTVKYTVNLIDQKGRVLPRGDLAGGLAAQIGYNLQTKIYRERKVLGIPVGWELYTEKRGGQYNVSLPIGEKMKFDIYYFKKKVYSEIVYPSSEIIINITLPFVPAAPLLDIRSESLTVSADIHEVGSKWYNVKFGMGDDENKIQIWVGNEHWDIPVNLELSGSGNSETKPFKFLAQSPNSTVEGKDKFLIWETGRYLSGVHTVKVGDNSLLVVWTFMYGDTFGAWKSKILTGIVAGAIAGTVLEPGAGTVVGALGGGIASAIVYSVKPQLANISAHTSIGVVAGYFTPRYFIIQGVGEALGSNGTSGKVSMGGLDTIPADIFSGNIRAEVKTSSNQIQIGFTKYYGTGITTTYQNFDWLTGDVNKEYHIPDANWTISGGIRTNGYVGYGLKNSNGLYYTHHGAKANHTYTVMVDYWIKKGSSNGIHPAHKVNWGDGSEDRDYSWIGSGWQRVTFTYTHKMTSDGNITISFARTTAGDSYIVDEIHIKITEGDVARIIFESSSGAEIVRHMNGQVPIISPETGSYVRISKKYTLIGIDIANKHGFLALDWASPQVTVYPATIFIKTETISEKILLLGTDGHFKDMVFTITKPQMFIYSLDFEQYYYSISLDEMENITTIDWTPWMANDTLIYTPPQGWNGWKPIDEIQYNIHGWWDGLSPLMKMAMALLPLAIAGIVILAVAPSLGVMMVMGIGKASVGLARATAKGIQGLGKAFARRRR